MTWDPTQYLRFDDHRMRPALDLLSRLPPQEPAEVWDLGCGTGAITVALSQRWPEAHVHGLDASPEMLDIARRSHGVDWVLGDIADWAPGEPVDMLFSNAALHWLDHHDRLLVRLFESVSGGGVMAVQMPRNHGEPSHSTLYALARSARWAERVAHLVVENPVAPPEWYHALLDPLATRLEVWESIYQQTLSGPDPVAEWTRGSVMRPYLEALGEEAQTFFDEYAAALRPHYPTRDDGVTLFAFRRLFIVARR